MAVAVAVDSSWCYGRFDFRLNSFSYCVADRFGKIDGTGTRFQRTETSRVKNTSRNQRVVDFRSKKSPNKISFESNV